MQAAAEELNLVTLDGISTISCAILNPRSFPGLSHLYKGPQDVQHRCGVAQAKTLPLICLPCEDERDGGKNVFGP